MHGKYCIIVSSPESHIKASQQLHKDSLSYGPASSYFQDTNIKRLFGIPYGIKIANEHSRIKSVLDFGAGNGGLVLSLNKILGEEIAVTGFDPGVNKYSEEPTGKFDVITCIDVLEHVDRTSIDKILNQIKNLTAGFMVFVIDLVPARKSLADGRNAHVLLAPPEYWASRINQAFDYSICFNIGELETGEKFPIKFVGCCCNEYTYYETMSLFIKESNFGNMRLVLKSPGEVNFKLARKDYEKLV